MKYTIEKLSKILIISMIIFVFMFGVTANVRAQGNSCEIVIDAESGRILHSLNEEEIRPMASLTKIITCITVIENYDVTKEIRIRKEWTGVEGSSVYLKEDEVLTVEELLYGLMLRSGNDCAVSLACSLSGSIENFAQKMNELAFKVGAINSSFKNPHGLDCEGHYTTAKDLAFITAYAMKNELFRKIVSTKKINIGNGENARTLYNKNKLLTNYEYATGVKTGYTKKAGRCLVSSSSKNEFNLICVVLNCGPMFERSQELLNSSYSNYKRIKLLSKDKAVGEIKTKKGNILPVYVKEDLFYPLKDNEIKEIEYQLDIDKNGQILEKFNQESGTIKILLKKQLLFERKIFTIIG